MWQNITKITKPTIVIFNFVKMSFKCVCLLLYYRYTHYVVVESQLLNYVSDIKNVEFKRNLKSLSLNFWGYSF